MRKSTVLILTTTALLAGFVLGSRRQPPKTEPTSPRIEVDRSEVTTVWITRPGADPVPQGKYRIAVVFAHGNSETRGPSSPAPVSLDFGGGNGYTLVPVE